MTPGRRSAGAPPRRAVGRGSGPPATRPRGGARRPVAARRSRSGATWLEANRRRSTSLLLVAAGATGEHRILTFARGRHREGRAIRGDPCFQDITAGALAAQSARRVLLAGLGSGHR